MVSTLAAKIRHKPERKSHGCSCVCGKNASLHSQSAVAPRPLLRGQMAEAESGSLHRHHQPGHGRVAGPGGRRFGGGRRSRHRRRQGGVPRMAARAAARTGEDAARDRRRPAQERRRARHDRRRRLRQPLCRDGARRAGGRGAARFLRRPCHRDERRLDPDGTGRGEFLRARAVRRRRAHHSVQPSLHVRGRQVGGAARRR